MSIVRSQKVLRSVGKLFLKHGGCMEDDRISEFLDAFEIKISSVIDSIIESELTEASIASAHSLARTKLRLNDEFKDEEIRFIEGQMESQIKQAKTRLRVRRENKSLQESFTETPILEAFKKHHEES